MIYDSITKATFLRRPNRFISEVEIEGHKEIVHVKNTGRCRELLIQGCTDGARCEAHPGNDRSAEKRISFRAGCKTL